MSTGMLTYNLKNVNMSPEIQLLVFTNDDNSGL